MNQHLAKVAENAQAFTYTSAGGTLVFWGLHISDIAAIISTMCAIAGVSLQFYMAFRRRRAK